ncbi:hypothetical protein [Amycolatopsis sp. lyj-109]|uniref:hypothetical protein n=1 Tax=Amycolatopsis sp. lyj-109 TaxID=2789287 RepID=UPI00397DF47F
MNDHFLVIWTVPGPWPGTTMPDPDGFADLVRSAMTIERRVAGGHAGQEDSRRFTATSAAIERIARRRGTPIATITRATLRRWAAAETSARALAGFHLPQDAEAWLRELANEVGLDENGVLTSALGPVRDERRGIVLSTAPAPVGPLLHGPQVVEPPPASPRKPDPSTASRLAAAEPIWKPFSDSPPRLRSAARLWSQLVRAVAEGEVVQIGAGARHDVLTEALRHMASVIGRPHDLRLTYVDGSEAEPFPIIALPHRPANTGRTVRVGLMSMRHTQLDSKVEGYWFRNRLVSTSRTLSDTDRFCAAATTAKLTELSSAGITQVELIQTGFEPAVIGFYRGLSTWLAKGGRIEVRPLYLIHDLVQGSPWVTEGDGR